MLSLVHHFCLLGVGYARRKQEFFSILHVLSLTWTHSLRKGLPWTGLFVINEDVWPVPLGLFLDDIAYT